jgi:hypothetical protein
VVYLVAIVGPALVLLYLGWQSVQRQRQAIANLTLSNLVLSGEKLAEELERQTASAHLAGAEVNSRLAPAGSQGSAPHARLVA